MILAEENNAEEINKFFPYKAYPQQIKLMNFLVSALLKTKNNDIEDDSSPKIILIESPTGTGKTMMILSCLMEFLDKINKIINKEEKTDNKKDNIDVNNNDEEEDWLKDFGKNQNKANANKIEEDNKIKKINQKMDFIITNIKKKIKKKDDSIFDKEEEKMLIKNENNIFNLFFQKNTPSIENQIFFCTRTHSQINQIVKEEKILNDYYNKHSSKFEYKKFPFTFTFIGSRKQLCINNKINNGTNSLNKINSLCKEINDKKETRCIFKKFMYDEANNENNKLFICEEMKAEIKDIEELLKFGEQFIFCPYYITHISINTSQFVISPYNNILNRRIKNNINLSLENSILVFDEAHNIIENILQNANTDINNNELIALLISIFLYYNQYKTKLNPSNNLCLRQIVTIIKVFLNFFQKIKNNKENNIYNNEEEYINIKLSDFTIENKINNYDFFKLVNFIDDSELSNKIGWLMQKEINNIKTDKKNKYNKKIIDLLKPQIKQYIENNKEFFTDIEKSLNYYLQIIISSNPLNKFCLLLMGILNVDDDGLMLYHKRLDILKFILINPIRDFNHLLI